MSAVTRWSMKIEVIMKKEMVLILSIVIFPSVLACCIGQETLELEGTTWNLNSYVNENGLVSVLPTTKITAHFQDGRVSGNAGCNSYLGTYHISGNTITVGSLSSTRMFCGEPEGLMEQEGNYLAALKSAAHYEITGSTLEMTSADGMQILTFTAAEEADRIYLAIKGGKTTECELSHRTWIL